MLVRTVHTHPSLSLSLSLSLQLEELKGQLHTTAQERSSLQQKLSSKSATLASLTAEVKGLQRQTKLSEEEMATLRQTAQERMTKISSLQSSVCNDRVTDCSFCVVSVMQVQNEICRSSD